MKIISKIKIWWLVVAAVAVSIISSKVFPSSAREVKAWEASVDSLEKADMDFIAKYDSISIVYSNALGRRDALSKQLDRNASQQIVIDKRTTNITRNYIVNDTVSKKK